jgi:hypothetical protein
MELQNTSEQTSENYEPSKMSYKSQLNSDGEILD